MNNPNIKVLKNPTSVKNQVELSVEAPADFSDRAYNTALRNVSDSIDIPGFRKGRAPKEMIEKQVGAGYISQKAFESIFYEVLMIVSIQENLDILEIVEVVTFELIPGKPLTFKVLVELKPEVKLGKYKNLKVKAKKIIYDKELFIQKTLERITANFISFSKAENGKVKEGDLVVLDFEGKFEDGTEVPGGKAENFQAVLEKDKFLPEFVDKLQGLKAGETKDISVTFPENYSTGFSGKKAKFKVKVNSVEHKVIPEVNDELAKKVGMENIPKLKEKILEQMIELQNVGSQREFENKIVEEIIKDSKCEISPTMLSREIDFLLNDVRMQCEKGGITWNSFKSDPKNKELFDKAQEAANNRIAIDLVLNAIIRKENIIVTQEEINNEARNRISQMGEKYKHLEHDKAFINTIRLVILRNKAIDFLIKNNEPVWDEKVTTLMPE